MNIMNQKSTGFSLKINQLKQLNKFYSILKIWLTLIFSIFSFNLVFSHQALAGADDDPLISKFMFDQLEVRDADQQNPFVLSGQFWLGYDLEKLWVKTDFESVNGQTEEAELQALYSKAIAPYWDFQLGIRKDFALDTLPGRNWAVVGIQGLAPYFFEIDTALFIGEKGESAFRFEAEYEMLFTQRLILTPEVKVNFYGQNDELSKTGAGLSDVEFGLRLRYEIRREFAPYIGINWTKKYGYSANISRLNGQVVSESEFVLGIRTWF